MPEKPSEIIDYQAEGLFEGVANDALDARRRLVDYLLDDERVPLAEIKQAAAEKRLMLLPVERALGGEPKYDAAEVAAMADVDLELFINLRRTLGLAEPALDQKIFSDYDVKVMRAVRANLAMGMSIEGIREINRVLGAGLSQLAVTVERQLLTTFLRPDDNEHDIAVRYAEITRMASPEFGFVLQHLFNLHLREATRADILGNPETIDLLSDTRETAVCFADLVGFTMLGEQVHADELGSIAERLNAITIETLEPPVRLVKTIGDAVMLVSPDSDALIDAALSLVEAVDKEPEGFPQLTAGIAVGEALLRGGDVYGPPVNYASRLCDTARPGSVVTTGELHERYERAYDWTEIGKRRFKGIEQPLEIFRVRARGGREREKAMAKAREEAAREEKRVEREREKALTAAEKSSGKTAKERERIAKSLEKELKKQADQREKAEIKARELAEREALGETEGVVAKPLAAAKQLATVIEAETIKDLPAKTAGQLKELTDRIPLKPAAKKPVIGKRAAKKAAAEQTAVKKPANKQIAAKKSAAKGTVAKSSTAQVQTAKMRAVKKSAVKKPVVEKPAVEKPGAKQPSAKNSSADKPGAKRSSVKKIVRRDKDK